MTEPANQVRELVDRHDSAGLWRLLERESRLPGPRANLELLTVVCDVFQGCQDAKWESTLGEWLQTPMIDAPVNSAAEFPIACAAAATASLLRVDRDNDLLLKHLAAAAHSERWRTREAVVIGLQRRGYRVPDVMLTILTDWAGQRDPFLERAVIATLADAPLLKHDGMLELAYTTTERSLDRLQSVPAAIRKTEGSRILEKALSYAISVFVAADPQAGFARLERWLARADRETRRIINTNLGKARITKPYPAEVARLRNILFESDDWER